MTELEMLRKKLRVILNNLADDLAGGGAENFEQYKFITGQIDGIARAERELLDLAENLRTDSEE